MLRFGNLTDEELTKLEEMLAASKAKLIWAKRCSD
jgi:hypothetical protein